MRLSTLPARAALASGALLASALAVHAQTDPLASALAHRVEVLEARLARRPTPRDRCELGSVYFRQERVTEAATTLDQAIDEYGVPTSGLDRRTLAGCLTSRGRVAEVAGEVERARVAYERSLELREDRATRERVEALGIPAYPASSPATRPLSALAPDEAAAARARASDDGTARAQTLARPARAGEVTWSLVAWESDQGGSPAGLSAVACLPTGCVADELDGDTLLGGNGSASVLSFVAHDGAPPVLEVRMERSAREGEATIVDETTLHLCALVDAAVRCVEVPVQDRVARVAYDATFTGGHLVLHRVSGRAPASQRIPLDRPLALAELLALAAPAH